MNISAFASTSTTQAAETVADEKIIEETDSSHASYTYDSDTGILTLNGFNSDCRLFISKTKGLTAYDYDDTTANTINAVSFAASKDSGNSESSDTETAIIYSETDLTIILTGSNSISNSSYYGIVSDGDLNIKGNGSLSIEGSQTGIYAPDGEVSISDADVKITDAVICAINIRTDNGSLTAVNYIDGKYTAPADPSLADSSLADSVEDFSTGKYESSTEEYELSGDNNNVNDTSSVLSSEDDSNESDELSEKNNAKGAVELSDKTEKKEELSSEKSTEKSEESEESSTDGITEGSSEGSTDDAGELSSETDTEESEGTSTDGSSDGITEGSTDDAGELSSETDTEESEESSTEGSTEGSSEGNTEDACELSSEIDTEEVCENSDDAEIDLESEDDCILAPLELSPESVNAWLDKTDITLLAGDKIRLTVGTSLSSDNYTVNWSSSNDNILLTSSGSSCLLSLPETYTGNEESCKVTAVVEFTDYTGSAASCSAACTVKIVPNDIPDGRIISDNVWFTSDLDSREYCDTELVYDGTQKKPSVKVYSRNKLLSAGKDYTVTYKNNIAAATADSSKAPSMTITMKGMYTGKYTTCFDIKTADLANSNNLPYKVVCEDYSVLYNKKQQLTPPAVTFNGKKLKYGTDYIVQEFQDAITYKNKNTFKGLPDRNSTYNLSIYGRGNFSGKIHCTYTIAGTICDQTSQIMISKASVSAIPSQPFKGEKYTTDDLKGLFTVKYKNKTFSYPDDYDIIINEASDSVNIGTVYLTLKGEGNTNSDTGYSLLGSRTVSFKITGRSISKAIVTETGDRNHVFTGETISPEFTVTYNKEKLSEGVDYVLSAPAGTGSDYYVSAGTKTVIITGINGYYGTKKITFSIKSTAISSLSAFTYEITDKNGSEDITAVYTKSGAKPSIKVSRIAENEEPVLLTEGIDYTVKYSNYSSVSKENSKKKPTITVTGKGSYKGSITKEYTITPASISNVCITASDLPETTKKGTYKAKLTVKDSAGKTLQAGTDYSKIYVYYDENMNDLDITSASGPQGRIYVEIEGIGNYCGHAVAGYRTYNVKETVSISRLYVVIDPMVYSGLPLEPQITDSPETNGIHIYKSSSDKKAGIQMEDPASSVRILSYSSNTKTGTGKVTLQGTGSYYGTRTCSFTIQKQPVKAFMTINTKELSLNKGEAFTINTSASAAAAAGINYTFVSSDPKVAAVDPSGTVTGISEGTAVIYAESPTLEIRGSCTVNVTGSINTENPDFINIESWRYYDGCPDIEAIKKAIEKAQKAQADDGRHKTIYIPSGTYIIPSQEQISFENAQNMSLVMEKDTVLITTYDNSNSYTYGIAINVRNSRNITITGGELIGDRNTAPDSPQSKQVYGINIRNSTGIYVSNVTIHDFWYDGIYVGNVSKHDINTYCSDVSIINCKVYDNRRNNISLTAARNTSIKGCNISNANGIDPECGLDIETNDSKNPNKNITISDTVINEGAGQGAFSIPTAAENVTFKNCEINGKCYNRSGKNLVLTGSTLNGTYYSKKVYSPGSWALLK